MEKVKLIDFLTEKIFEEAMDANVYTEHAAGYDNPTVKSTLSKIADEEVNHQKLLVKLLAEIAKGNGEN